MQRLKHPLLIGVLIGMLGCAGAKKIKESPDHMVDPDNCGQKGNVCVSRNDGACREGYCRCNGNNDCHWPEECRTGVCQPQDKDGLSCLTDNDCGGGQFCIGNHCSRSVCLSEICDGFDNNCDGQVDEPEKTDIACYNWPPGTLGIGACHAGIRSCFMGVYTPCLHEFVPHAEVGRFSCDGKDSDCDGCIDGSGGGTIGCKVAPVPTATFIIVLDTSGSMSMYIEPSKMVLDTPTFAKFKDDLRFKWCLIDVAAETFPFIKVVQSCTDFDTFLNTLNTFAQGQNGGEPTYDAVYNISTGIYDAELNLNRDSMPVIIVFGDEYAQTLMTPVPLNEFKVCDALDNRGAFLTIITHPLVYPDWDECAADFSYPLSIVPAEMEESLKGALSLPCFKD